MIERFAPAAAEVAAFRLLRAPAQDPHVIWHEGTCYYCESTSRGLFLRMADHFLTLTDAPRIKVWSPSRTGLASRNIWAPEMHRIDGRFYIYFAADDGENANHRLWVLGSATNSPLGPYVLVGSLQTGGWAIDGTVLTMGDRRYLVWSGWPGARNGRQNLYIAAMKGPTELATNRVLLTSAELSWETHGMPICEGPQILQRAGRTFIVYSASGSWTEHYCLGLLEFVGDDCLDAGAWRKTPDPVFQKNEYAWGTGHCGFATTPDGGQDWMLYHVKTSRRVGWSDREVRAQRFSWSPDGTPLLGSPGRVTARSDLASARPVLAKSA